MHLVLYFFVVSWPHRTKRHTKQQEQQQQHIQQHIQQQFHQLLHPINHELSELHFFELSDPLHSLSNDQIEQGFVLTIIYGK